MRLSRAKRRALAKPYRSLFEKDIANALQSYGYEVEYEKTKIDWVSSDGKSHKYTPDFKIAGTSYFIEAKGIFDWKDREKHLCLKRQHPELEIRFVFYKANSKTKGRNPIKYKDWCEAHGFIWSDAKIPNDWLPKISSRQIEDAP